MSRPNPTPPTGAPAPQVRRPATAQFPGLPSLLRSSSSAGPSTGAGGQTPKSAVPSHLLGRSSVASSSLGKGTPAASKEKVALPARTSKSSKKFVALPEAVQSTPLPSHPGTQPIDRHATPPRVDGHESDRREQESPDERSAAERMTKEERERNGFGRLTAYATAESYRLKSLAAFLKREHGAEVRIFDEAIYAVYTLPLLPGYGANVKVRSSQAVKSPGGGSILHAMDKAEETGYEGSYFAFEQTDSTPEHIPSSSPVTDHGFHHAHPSTSPPVDLHLHHHHQNSLLSDQQLQSISSSPTTHHTLSTSPPGPGALHHEILVAPPPQLSPTSPTTSRARPAFIPMRAKGPGQAEGIFYDYGVSVFFGFTEGQEQDILEDCENGGTWDGAFGELGQDEDVRGWEKEECHFLYDPTAQYPRIFNDLFTFKSSSHLLKLSLSHALAQSTKLSVYETAVQATLADTAYIPKELALTGELALDRREAVKLTGRLFRLRVEVNLVSNVLDTPELFWSEPSLTLLYEAVKEYLELEGRIAVLNEKLGVAGDLLEIIHEHVDNAGMHKVTIIIIWLIVVACFVEFGEVVARLVFHTATPDTVGKSGLRLLAQSAGRSFRKY